MRKTQFISFMVVGAFALFGCSPWMRIEQSNRTGSLPLTPETTIGQTFTAQYDGLQSISVHLQPGEQGTGNLVLSLYDEVGEDQIQANSTLPVVDVKTPGWYQFSFQAQASSNQHDYYYEIGIEGTGSVLVSTATGDTYLDGALYLNREPQDAQTAFRLTYNQKLALIGLIKEGVGWFRYLLIAIWLFIIPGWGLLALLYSDWSRRSWPEKIALAAGTSLAVYPVMFLWMYLFGLNLGPIYAWLPPIAGLAAIIFHLLRVKKSNTKKPHSKPDFESLIPNIALILVIGFVIFTRFWVIRQIEIPLWGDSYQHSLIAQLLVNNNGLFNSWEPFVDLQSFTYHFGFHTLVAAFHWVTDLPLPQATLWTGQIINILAILVLVPLAIRIGRGPWAGTVAILIAGLLSPMPQVYVNWGRYTQLASLVIMPVLVYLFWQYIENRTNWRFSVALWLLFAGIALTHYRVFIMTILFIPAIFLFEYFNQGVKHLVLKIIIAGLGGAILFLPWFVHVFSGQILNILISQISRPVSTLSDFNIDYNSIGNISNYLSPVLWIIMILGIAWGLWKRNSDIRISATWWLFILLATNPNWFNLPGAGTISNFAVFISAYIPAGLFIGAAAAWLIDSINFKLEVRYHRGYQFILLILFLNLCFFGIRSRIADLNLMGNTLFTRPDHRAVIWIDKHLPSDAKFLVNSFFAYGGGLIAGSDGGWWLPLLTKRQTSQPPLNYGNETGPINEYMTWINSLQTLIQDKGINHPEVLDQLHQRNFNYIYLGQRSGRVNNPGYVLDPEEILASDNFSLLYHHDRVYIFEVKPLQ